MDNPRGRATTPPWDTRHSNHHPNIPKLGAGEPWPPKGGIWEGWVNSEQAWPRLGSSQSVSVRDGAERSPFHVGLTQIASADDVEALPARGGNKAEQERAGKSAVH